MGWRQRVAVLAAALWWGSLGAIGFLVVPLLFAHLPTPALAGQTAAKLFSAQAWVGVGCGIAAAARLAREGRGAAPGLGRRRLAFVLAGLLLALLLEFAVAPRIVAAPDLRFWHTAGSVMYVLQWVCALVVLWRVSSAGRTGLPPPRVTRGSNDARVCEARRNHSARPFFTDFCFGLARLTCPPEVRRWLPSTRSVLTSGRWPPRVLYLSTLKSRGPGMRSSSTAFSFSGMGRHSTSSLPMCWIGAAPSSSASCW